MLSPSDNSDSEMPGAALMLRVGHARFRCSGSIGSEVARCPALVGIPGTPPWLLGVGFCGAELAPVIDLQSLFNDIPAYRADQGQVFLTRAAGRALAYWVDDVDQVAALGSASSELPNLQDVDLLYLGRALMAYAMQAGAQS